MGALVPTVQRYTPFLYSLSFTKSKTAAMGSRHGVVPSWSSSQCAYEHPQQERIFGRPGEIREELQEQASALTQCRHCRKLLGGA